ncbi:MAG: extracellular solute-binding protein [Oscillospiraceae bacterium]|nr:extracellular solute-binding protein [Oscillospiraceae bacterium]
MKKLIALLLVLCMVFTLVACGKKPNTTDPTDGNTEPEGTRETTPIRDDISAVTPAPIQPGGNSGEGNGDDTPPETIPNSNDEFINPEKFGGKELQFYGISSVVFDDIENMGKGSFLWMMRAAIDEWAYLNDVTVTYDGDYDANTILAAIKSGEKPDLLLFNMSIPGASNLGITRAFTQEEYDQLSAICGTTYLDMMNYKGESHGLVLPWSGNCLFYYNRTMFENYGIKSPKDYYLEGNWTYDTCEQCLTEVTKDKDGNGKIDKDDTYGSGSLGWMGVPYELVEGDDGKLTGLIGTSEYFKRFVEISYRAKTETLMNAGPIDKYVLTATPPMVASYVGDCEWYNFEHLYQTIANGDVVEVVPLPVFSSEDSSRWNIWSEQTMSIMSSCDEPEAVLSLMSYMLKVGIRYISDFSVGLYENSYEGIRGASEYSAAWKEQFELILEDRRAAFAEIEDWDHETYVKIVEDLFAAEGKLNRKYLNKTGYGEEFDTMPPASSIPHIAAAQNSWIATYNNLYAK